jgi:dienelactone hydrolase
VSGAGRLVALGLVALLAGCGGEGRGEPEGAVARPQERGPQAAGRAGSPDDARERPGSGRLPGITTARAFGDLGAEGPERWRRDVPGARDVRIRSTADGREQPAMWLPPSRPGPRPLLVVLHSWSNRYRQHLGIVYARWAQRHGWAMIAPNFRGVNVTPQAAGSDLAVRDVLDAVDHAARAAEVDERRVFLVGFSGGGMMSLLMAGRHPERFAGAVAWVPVHDLLDWHAYNAGFVPPRGYASHIEQACGGDPRYVPRARRSCERRSPRRWLERARRAGVPVYLGHGLGDTLVPPGAALRAFNQLADPEDRIGRRSVARVDDNRLPGHLRGAVEAETHFGRQDPDVLFARRSGPATVVLFEGEHDMVFHPGLEWMARLARDGAG